MESGGPGAAEDSRSSSAGSIARMSPKVTATPPVATTPMGVAPLYPATTILSSSAFLYRNSSPSMPKKILSKNHNNTIYPTSYPSNLAELQLFRVMQNASLLYYYDTLLEMGGDDVYQLCDAGEEEFLEIMSLVGMASKPLHVRRLQKSLQEWVSNPHKFKTPLIPGEDFEVEVSSPRISSNHGLQSTMEVPETSRPSYSPSPGEACPLSSITSPSLHIMSKRPYSPLDGPTCPPSSSSSPGASSSNVTPALLESQIAKIAAAAEKVSKQIPQLEPKPFSTKKKMCKELELVMSMSENDPRRMDEIRRYAAIYGRFDCKRRPEKPLTLHEVSVNEAAAQICRFVPSLLTRRDELFPLARQIVKESGLNYSKTHVSSTFSNKLTSDLSDIQGMTSTATCRASPKLPLSETEQPSKKPKLESDVEAEFSNSSGSHLGSSFGQSTTNFPKIEHQEETTVTRSSIRLLFQQQSRNITSKESSERNTPVMEEEDTFETPFLYSNSSSPFQKTIEDQKDYETDDENKMSPNVQVIAASGDNIIAVANPALAMSSAILPRKLEDQ